MSAQASKQGEIGNERYLLGKLVAFTFKQAASESASIEGVVVGFAHVGGQQCAYMHTGTGEEFFVPLENVAYLMISNQGTPSAQLMQEKAEGPIDKLPAGIRPPVIEGGDEPVAPADSTIENIPNMEPSSEQLVHSLKKLMEGGPNETE